MQFSIYVINLASGEVQGTDSVEATKNFVEDSDYLVLHIDGTFFNGSDEQQEAEPLVIIDEDRDEDDDEDDDE